MDSSFIDSAFLFRSCASVALKTVQVDIKFVALILDSFNFVYFINRGNWVYEV